MRMKRYDVVMEMAFSNIYLWRVFEDLVYIEFLIIFYISDPFNEHCP